MNFGKIIGELATEYHATPAVGCHKLTDFVQSPLLYYRRYISHEAPLKPQTPALLFGQYCHSLFCEGEAVTDQRYIIAPDGMDRRTREGKAQYAELLSTGKIIISNDDKELAWRMLESIRGKSKAREIFNRGNPEVTFRKQMASFPIQCRCDWYDETPDDRGRPLIVDVKTIDALGEFDYQFHKLGYFRQAGMYQMVVQATLGLANDVLPRFVFLVCEKEEPFDVSLREPDDISLEIGRAEVFADLQRLKACYDANHFPGEPDEIRAVSLPEWKIAKSLA